MNCKVALIPAALLALAGVSTFAQAASPNASYAQYQGSSQDQAACRPDARRYCRNVGNDQMRVLYCLQDNRARLSKACLAVLQRNGQ
jgi:Cysteine rich repeat